MTGRRISMFVLLTVNIVGTACWRLPEAGESANPDAITRDRSRANELLPFGDPSNATSDPANSDNFLVYKRSFVFSYNNHRGTVNWIAWGTSINDLGEGLPRPQFAPDPDLPRGFVRIVSTDYSGSGYDRGHMVPSADRFGDPRSNEDTFLMTNVVPQTADLNQYVWEKLERYARGIVRRGSEIYTIAGVYGQKQRIKNKLTVPTNCWKIIVVLAAGTGSGINENTRLIAVDIPNENGIKNIYWQRFRTSVRTLEQKTGYNFFSNLPVDVQDKLETRIDDK